MLQALFHNKLKSSFTDSHFSPSEDSLTSSVLGLMQYLSDDIILTIFKNACGSLMSSEGDLGDIIDFRFWEHWNGSNTSNSIYVEPDVWIETSNLNLIIEVKKTDYGGQYEVQWRNEIIAFQNTYPESTKKLVLIPLGGNASLTAKSINVREIWYKVFPISWFNLLRAIKQAEASDIVERNSQRVLRDIISAFEMHNYFDIEWLDTLHPVGIKSQNIETVESLMQRNFEKLYTPLIPLNSNQTVQWLQWMN